MRRKELLFRAGVFASVSTLEESEPEEPDPEESEYDPEEPDPEESKNEPEEFEPDEYGQEEYEPMESETEESDPDIQPCQEPESPGNFPRDRNVLYRGSSRGGFEQQVEKPHCHQRVEVQPQLYEISPSGPECLPLEEWRLSPPDPSAGQHYVHPGEGRSLPSKDVRRDPQQVQKVPVTTKEPLVSPKIALPEPASTVSPSGLRTSSLGGPTIVATSFLPGTEVLVAGVKAAVAAAGRPHRSRTWVTGIGCLGKGKIAKDRPSTTDVVCRSPSGSEAFAAGGRAATDARIVLKQHHVHPGEGRPPHASVKPQQEPGGPATMEEPSGMLGIICVESASSTTPPSDPERSLLEGKRLSPPDSST